MELRKKKKFIAIFYLVQRSLSGRWESYEKRTIKTKAHKAFEAIARMREVAGRLNEKKRQGDPEWVPGGVMPNRD